MIGDWTFHGHAIVSANECIADADGRMPAALRNAADWARFQSALDRAAVVVLGRLSHELTPNPKGRTRLVMTLRGPALERRAGAIWWNPQRTPLAAALAEAGAGGVAAIVGGRAVFDHFLSVGFDEFHLARAGRLEIAGGVPLFSGIAAGRNVADVLSDAGLVSGPDERLDPANDVSLTVWRRGA